jgi:hypothetical protein
LVPPQNRVEKGEVHDCSSGTLSHKSIRKCSSLSSPGPPLLLHPNDVETEQEGSDTISAVSRLSQLLGGYNSSSSDSSNDDLDTKKVYQSCKVISSISETLTSVIVPSKMQAYVSLNPRQNSLRKIRKRI